MIDPIVVEVVRGGLVESRHRGAIAVVDSGGTKIFAAGDVGRPVFPRSAVKPFQALPLVETGAADKFALSDEELALVLRFAQRRARARSRRRADIGESGFRRVGAGVRYPLAVLAGAAMALARTGVTPSALHNNCSGKHAGFLCVARAMEVDHAGYWRPDHAVQQRVHAVLEDLTAKALPPDCRAVDGCSVPTWAVPLENLASAFAKIWQRPRARSGTRGRGGALARRVRETAVVRRRERPVLHRDHAASRHAGAGQNRSRGRHVRGVAGARSRHCD